MADETSDAATRFGALVRERREALGMTLAEVSAALRAAGQSVSTTALAKAEVGSRAVKIAEAVALATVLDIEVDLRRLDARPDDLVVLREQAAEEYRAVQQRMASLSEQRDRLEAREEALDALMHARTDKVGVTQSQAALLEDAFGRKIEHARRGLIALGMGEDEVAALLNSGERVDLRAVYAAVPLKQLLPNLGTA